MNVLVYTGPETLPSSHTSALTTLKRLLHPHYAVQALPLASLTAPSYPWRTACALLVLPRANADQSQWLPKPAQAAVQAHVDEGGALLEWEPVNDGLVLTVKGARAAKIAQWVPAGGVDQEQEPLNRLRETLVTLGLQGTLSDPNFNAQESEHPTPHPLPQFLTAAPGKIGVVARIAGLLGVSESGDGALEDENDSFVFHPGIEGPAVLSRLRQEPVGVAEDGKAEKNTREPKHVVLCTEDALPGRDLAPLFNLAAYYEALSAARSEQGCETTGADSWGLGEALLYSEVVTSTQTMLDK
ncbi:hypothetical protein H0H81_008925 [Sphagnurus paluster]|uniref:Biotin-protein ligase N-terminal domain-containing protein n=1 Tax=Sphagnurus paluster TaxID=117069 RepID=A0A9P7FKT9_9AGAR|nr:hypothetical protein H0H81_008925 [Sphagnurus paluster]